MSLSLYKDDYYNWNCQIEWHQVLDHNLCRNCNECSMLFESQSESLEFYLFWNKGSSQVVVLKHFEITQFGICSIFFEDLSVPYVQK